MTYRGHIKDGAIVLDEPVALPEGAEVEVALRSGAEEGNSLFDRFSDVIGICPELPPDMARNHDHYLHGREKK
ncbi:MAG TPA: hypothetical protein VH253_15515 [Phycisphaerae bacterium]|nr:hypothetical protein [Phycisphaerae bacterium]